MKHRRISDTEASRKDVEAGSWHDEADEILRNAIVDDSEENVFVRPEYSEGLIRICQKYSNLYGSPRSVFYPGCGIDASPLRGFPNSEIVFLDPDETSVRVMREANIDVLQKRIEDYNGKHDLILLLNPHFNPKLALQNLEREGKIIANNYFGAPAAQPLEEYGLPVLKKFMIRGDDVIEVSHEDAKNWEHYAIFRRSE